MTDKGAGELPPSEKPTLSEYISGWLPFKLPSIPLPQTRKNLDKAFGKLILSGSDWAAAWTARSSKLANARADAMTDLIRSGSQAALDRVAAGDKEMAERAIIAAIGDDIQSQRNRERIAEFASDELEHNPITADASSAIDDDWLNAFSERASRVSKEEMQRLWGRVLGGEIRQPGSFRLRSLQALSLIDAAEAHLIYEHMDLVFRAEAVFVGEQNQFASLDALLELENMGVLQGAGGFLNQNYRPTSGNYVLIPLAANNAIRVRSDKPLVIDIKCCILTPFGKELYELAKPATFRAGLPEAIASLLKRADRVIELVKLHLHQACTMSRCCASLNRRRAMAILRSRHDSLVPSR